MELKYNMTSKNIKAPYEYMGLKEYKLSDFVPEFSEFRQSDDLSRFGCENIENNLIKLDKHGKIHFEKRNKTLLLRIQRIFTRINYKYLL